MNYELVQNGKDVDLLLDEVLFCTMINTNKKTDSTCVSDLLEVAISSHASSVSIDLSNVNFDMFSLAFPNIKQLNNQSYYQETDGNLITIDCSTATLVSNRNLVVSVYGSAKIVFARSHSFSASSFNQMAAFDPELVFEKVPPSFSITFYQNFDGSTFTNLFDSYKSQQILSAAKSVNGTPIYIYVKIISKIADSDAINTLEDIQNATLTASTHYTLAVYSEFSSNRRVAPMYKTRQKGLFTTQHFHYQNLIFIIFLMGHDNLWLM